ncbi:MAG: hypothetical protein AVDCRST_MAG76-3479 [uncultured Acidimicrobiales bacterium]|uniref:Lipoprotein n=1 Tax=uncultured Acidimicrobiales bacterium TaxID=310071 RepID=A0A6J4JA31_9ACTN|nr:MAG: hypothetical protein AVDCRST_MAG76-3479 [uncultured Acidimicrobiales bacterium]
MPGRRSRAGLAAVTAAALSGAALAACAPGAVRVAFRPRVGARYGYQVEVRTRSTLSVDGQQSVSRDVTATLQVDQRVLMTGDDGSVVEVVLRTTPEDERTVLVRLDRAAQLVGLEPVAGKDAAALGDLGVAEVFPAAVGAPPDRPLRPGERWRVDSPVNLPASTPSRLVGEGRLTGLGVVSGRRAATVTTASTLPVVRRTGSAGRSEAVLEGTQQTTTTASHTLADGAIQAARSTTRASYALRLLPPTGLAGDPVRGRLELEVTSSTKRS